jgi:signal transduction histidine kinase
LSPQTRCDNIIVVTQSHQWEPVIATGTNLQTGAISAMRRIDSLLYRTADDRVISGLAGGIAHRLGVRTTYVRAAFIVLAFAGGIGIALYLAGWALTVDRLEEVGPRVSADRRQLAGLALVFVGMLVFLRTVGIWFGDSLMWAVALVSFGTAAMWDRPGADGPGGLGAAITDSNPGRLRIAIGALVMVAGLATLIGNLGTVSDLGPAIVAAALTAAGFMLVFGPWVLGLVRDLGKERLDRVRSQERAEMAAHLHDSVLQTLALIQRSDDPRQMVTLARGQERELRGWLYGPRNDDDDDRVGTVIEQLAARIEQDHRVPVEVVRVGDAPLDARTRALAAATGEAIANAARHSGAERVSVFMEVEPRVIEVYVTDQGDGFDPSQVPEDRRGIRDSIMGRMQRHGGTADIVSHPGEGTEVRLTLPREAP